MVQRAAFAAASYWAGDGLLCIIKYQDGWTVVAAAFLHSTTHNKARPLACLCPAICCPAGRLRLPPVSLLLLLLCLLLRSGGVRWKHGNHACARCGRMGGYVFPWLVMAWHCALWHLCEQHNRMSSTCDLSFLGTGRKHSSRCTRQAVSACQCLGLLAWHHIPHSNVDLLGGCSVPHACVPRLLCCPPRS
jgi:hypothetical protein